MKHFLKAIALSYFSFLPHSFAAMEADPTKQYDFLKGDWDCQWIQYQEGKEASRFNCDWSGKYTLEGTMFQDDFRMYNDNKQLIYAGTTLRTYVKSKKRWDMAFLASSSGHWPNFHGVWQENEMYITSQGVDAKGEHKTRIRFYDIQQGRFIWEMQKSYDDGKTWQLDSEIRAKRKS